MEFYVISPVSDLALMEQGTRIFALAHLWPIQQYREFILKKKEEGWFITLDNSAAEKELVTEDILINIVKELLPNEVISPDVLFDTEATLGNLSSFIDRMGQEDLLDTVNIFAVAQGETKEDWLYCYKQMLSNDDVKTIGWSKIGVPYAFRTGNDDDQGIMEGRHACYDELMEAGLIQKPIHCLGAGDPREFLKYKNNPLMRSTDSCFSVWAGMCGIDWESGNFKRIKTPKNYFHQSLSEADIYFAKRNIKFLRQIVTNTIENE